jgi:hypothetical protein
VQLHTTQPRVRQVGTRERATGQVGVREIRFGQAHPRERDPSQVLTAQDRVGPVAALDGQGPQVAPDEGRPDQLAADQPGERQPGALEPAAQERAVLEDGRGQVCSGEVRFLVDLSPEVLLGQVGAAEVSERNAACP